MNCMKVFRGFFDFLWELNLRKVIVIIQRKPKTHMSMRSRGVWLWKLGPFTYAQLFFNAA